MKKVYEQPTVEKISFCYRDQVVTASGVKEVQIGEVTDGKCAYEHVDFETNDMIGGC